MKETILAVLACTLLTSPVGRATVTRPSDMIHHPPPTQAAPPPTSQPAPPPDTFTSTWEHADAIRMAADEWSIDPWLLLGLFSVESGLVVDAHNERTRAVGVAQFTTGGRRAVENLRRWRGRPGRFTRQMALDPRQAVPAAAELLAYLRSRCGGVDRALAAYNTGRCSGKSPWFIRKVHAEAGRLRAEVAPNRHPGQASTRKAEME